MNKEQALKMVKVLAETQIKKDTKIEKGKQLALQLLQDAVAEEATPVIIDGKLVDYEPKIRFCIKHSFHDDTSTKELFNNIVEQIIDVTKLPCWIKAYDPELEKTFDFYCYAAVNNQLDVKPKIYVIADSDGAGGGKYLNTVKNYLSLRMPDEAIGTLKQLKNMSQISSNNHDIYGQRVAVLSPENRNIQVANYVINSDAVPSKYKLSKLSKND